ncbi:hypothetical protein [Nocardioides daphniae]|uniref:Acyltransferase 3 domain-containing protein n=1 Tax=Nocardioides daphniae TaxID=402297 RepID=A0A4P7UD84_9ACTN|nr:hypothetical protein [Nocardioides daphniae]QCC78190.1 hypothetical protein E2C04_15130 [Nocardioides daphniae]
MPTVTSRPGREAASAPLRRDPWIDNAKTVLVTLVVVGHFLTIAPESAPAAHVYDFLYLFHIPAFVLVSGGRRATRPGAGATSPSSSRSSWSPTSCSPRRWAGCGSTSPTTSRAWSR